KKETVLAQSGLVRDEKNGSICVPVYYSATYRHPSLGKTTGFDYSRTLNPTRKVLEDCIASTENGSNGYAFASGMAALTAIFSVFSAGDHFIVSEDLYGGTFRLLDVVFQQFGFHADFVDTTDPFLIRKFIRKSTKAILIETPSNPLLRITSIPEISKITKEQGLLSIVDNTFMTPYLQQPLNLGADIVVHSGTKYLGGHNDVLCGMVVTKDPLIGERIGFVQNATGGVLSAHDSFLMLRGMKTLAVRIDRAQENSSRIARWLSENQFITKVYYPELENHPGRDIHLSQADGFGAMISFRVKNATVAEKVINSVKLISFAESLGGVESLITYPIVQTHGSIPEEMRDRIGITDDLLRLSVGIEHIDDLIEDLSQAIEG
ncbi:MAG TPA: PLP-dependent aspartate aminotransferase family protein, partial [Spirochaetota bacterium]